MKLQLAYIAAFLSFASAQNEPYAVSTSDGYCPALADGCGGRLVAVPCDGPSGFIYEPSSTLIKLDKDVMYAGCSNTPADEICVYAGGRDALTSVCDTRRSYKWEMTDSGNLDGLRGCLVAVDVDGEMHITTGECTTTWVSDGTVEPAAPAPAPDTAAEEPAEDTSDMGDEGGMSAPTEGDGEMEETEEMEEMELPGSLVELLMAGENYTTLVAAIEAAGLKEVLESPGNFTLFAPTDAAFAMVANETAMYLQEEYQMHLADILSYHVLTSKVMAAELSEGPVEMANEETAEIALGDSAMINEATITKTDMKADNGIAHEVDMVLVPSWVGVDLVTAASEAPIFSALVENLLTANLTGALMGGPFTVFAPTNDAFAMAEEELTALLEGVDEEDVPAALAEILLYHVHSGILTSATIGDEVDTLAGESLMFTLEVVELEDEGDEAMVDNSTEVVVAASEVVYVAKINNATIIDDDVLVNNGVIHVIDQVLIPPAMMMRKK